ncbi:MAG: hypothetical protein QOF62_2685 [Pyrinomonadaceae bacterium]|jgi:hypothetical protein|nr:hypothetical protein [Pyrinomonadaceae bacterium]
MKTAMGWSGAAVMRFNPFRVQRSLVARSSEYKLQFALPWQEQTKGWTLYFLILSKDSNSSEYKLQFALAWQEQPKG